MSLDLLFPNFETLIRTPEDVARLNEAILQLAVQGRLVPQDPTDEPASDLLKRIRAEKRRWVKEGKLQEPKPFPAIASTDTPFGLPQGWVWTRLGNFVELEYGKGLPQKARADDGSIPVYGSNGIVGYHSEALVDSPCVVIGRKGSSGAVNLSFSVCWVIDTAYYTLPPVGTDLGFIFRLMQSLKLNELGKGIKPGLNRNEAYNLIVGIPPLAEQRRIVAKVESLFAQTCALEAKLRQAQADIVTVNRAALNRLSVAADADAFAAAWATVRDAFDLLYDDPRNVAELRQAILQLAVQGKLVPQDPADEPASELLKRIRAEKRRLVKEGEIGEDIPLPPIQPNEIPFGLSKGWMWCRLGDAIRFIDYRGKTPTKTESGMRLLTAKNVKMGYLSQEPRECVDASIYDSWMTRGIPKKGDLLFTTEAPLGNLALLDSDERTVLAQRIITMQPYGADFCTAYLLYALMSPPVRSLIFAKATGTTALGVKATRLKLVLVPFPPLAEQRRIVAKVDQLMRQCDALEAGSARAEGQRRALTAAALHGAFG